MEKRLYRSDENKVICGVCGGLGEYFNIDPTIVRLLWAILVFSGPGIFAYIVAAIVLPRRRSRSFRRGRQKLNRRNRERAYSQCESGKEYAFYV